jgi:tripartite-type tricarboxylate transporter receptor subunit TctC
MKNLLFALLFLAEATIAATVEIVVPFTPGGAADIFARSIQKHIILPDLEAIVINKPGAEGRLAIQYSLSKPSTQPSMVVATPGPFVFNHAIIKNVDYSIEDFEYIAPLAETPIVVSVHPKSKIYNLKDLIAESKKRSLNCGTNSTATLTTANHLFKELGITNIQTIVFKGSSDLSVQLMGGHIDCGIDTLLVQEPYHKAHKLQIIAVSSRKKINRLPEIETFNQYVLGLTFSSWYGLAIPKNLSTLEKARLTTSVRNLVYNKDFVQSMIVVGLEVAEPQENYSKTLSQDLDKVKKMLK